MGNKEGFFKEHARYYGYGLGEFGFTFFLVFIAYHLLFFITDVLKWPAVAAATVYTVIQWFESSTNILMGIFVEKVNVKGSVLTPADVGKFQIVFRRNLPFIQLVPRHVKNGGGGEEVHNVRTAGVLC